MTGGISLPPSIRIERREAARQQDARLVDIEQRLERIERSLGWEAHARLLRAEAKGEIKGQGADG